MSLAALRKTKTSRVVGIDASTNSVAFCVMDNGIPVRYGKIELNGQDIYEKIYDAKNKVRAFKQELNADYIAVEGAILVRSPDAVIKLSYVYGVVIAELMEFGAKVVTVSPSSWQNYIGNKNMSKAEKDDFYSKNPGRKDSWYRTQLREARKQRTCDFINNKWGITIKDYDVADSIAISYYAYEKLTDR
jgi:Holliday junction resolvasome RuvABC endonuclease subunit